MKELNIFPTNICGGGYEKVPYKNFKDWRTNVVLLMKGGVKLDSYCLARDRS